MKATRVFIEAKPVVRYNLDDLTQEDMEILHALVGNTNTMGKVNSTSLFRALDDAIVHPNRTYVVGSGVITLQRNPND